MLNGRRTDLASSTALREHIVHRQKYSKIPRVSTGYAIEIRTNYVVSIVHDRLKDRRKA